MITIDSLSRGPLGLVFDYTPSLALTNKHMLRELSLYLTSEFEDLDRSKEPADLYAVFNEKAIENEKNPDKDPKINRKIDILAWQTLAKIPGSKGKIDAVSSATEKRVEQGLTEFASKSGNLLIKLVKEIENKFHRHRVFINTAHFFAKNGLEEHAFRTLSLLEKEPDRKPFDVLQAREFIALGASEGGFLKMTIRAAKLFIKPGPGGPRRDHFYATVRFNFREQGLEERAEEFSASLRAWKSSVNEVD